MLNINRCYFNKPGVDFEASPRRPGDAAEAWYPQGINSAAPHKGIEKGNAGIARKRQPYYIAVLKMSITCSSVAVRGLVS